ncbi:hypothetical protein RBLE17_27970 [Rhodobacteraceae bacterium LE17]|nr:hypothetical protein [Rhodobacteraceae bacterium LE17]
MRKTPKSPGEKIVKDIKRATRKHYSSEEKIRIVLDGLRGEDSIAELCRREGIAQGIYYKWSKDFMEAGKKRLAGDTARAANTDEVKELRLIVAVLFPLSFRWWTNSLASCRVYSLTSRSPATDMKALTATLGGVRSIRFNARYSAAISDRATRLGWKLSMMVERFTGGAFLVVFQTPSRISLSRLENASASSGSFDSVSLMN